MLRPRLPYRLDLTVEALRRVPANVVDVVAPDGRYLRALHSGDGAPAIVEVSQRRHDALDVQIAGAHGKRCLRTVETMLGTNVDLHDWYRQVKGIPWLGHLARRLRGVKPPRYPELWEALCHGIVFQQLSIIAAAAIMQRFVRRFSTPLWAGSVQLYPFPRPETIARAHTSTLQSIGLSRMKASYLKEAARCVLSDRITSREIESSPSDEAAAILQSVRGIGRWSATVVLLRGFGRLDVFPPLDSGAARSMKLLSTNPRIDANELLLALDGTRGMLYFHLLLGAKYGMTTP